MAAQTPRNRKSADVQASRIVKCSVSLDVATHARLSAAAALEGIDKSTYMSRCIIESLKGIVLFDRRSSTGRVDLSSGEGSAKCAVAVE